MNRLIKLYNLGIISLSWLVSSIVKKPVLWGMPFALGLELSSYCNLKCPECPTGSDSLSRPRGYMDDDLFNKIIDELSPYIQYMMLYLQGESMMHPRFFEYLEKCRGMGLIISTNGHFIDSDGAARLAVSGGRKVIISMDGFSQEVYSKYRIGGDVEKVIESVNLLSKAFSKVRKAPVLEIQCLVSLNNENEIKQIQRFAKKTGAKLRLKSLQIISEGSHQNYLPARNNFSRYRCENGKYMIKSRLPNRCYRIWTNPVISWDGKVLPCCFDKDAEHSMGDIRENTFKEIWRGEDYNRFREDILNKRAGIFICNNCTQGLERGIKV